MSKRIDLMEAWICSADLNMFAASAAEIMGNPFLFCDTNYNVVGSSNIAGINDRAWCESVRQGYIIDEMTEEIIAKYRKDDMAVKTNRPFVRKLKVSRYLWVVANAYFQQRLYGTTNMLCVNPFDIQDEESAEYFAIISDIFAKHMMEKRHEEIEYVPYAEIFGDLITGDINSKTLLRDRINNTELAQTEEFQLVSIFLKDNLRSVVEALKKSVMTLRFKGWIFFHGNYMFILTDVSKTQESFENFIAGLENHLKKRSMRGCISDRFSDLSLLHVCDLKNKRALNYAKYFNNENPALIRYCEYRFWDLVTKATNAFPGENIEQLMDQRIVHIWNQDKLNRTENFMTLLTYFNMNRSLILTAKKLFTHKNTVAYRILRMKEQYGMNFDDPVDFFNLYYSCMALGIYDGTIRNGPQAGAGPFYV